MTHLKTSLVALLVHVHMHVCTSAVIVLEFDPSAPHWLDTDGNRIEAHAAGMLQSPKDGRWYWYGESKKTSDLSTHGVSCYSAATVAGECVMVCVAWIGDILCVGGSVGTSRVSR